MGDRCCVTLTVLSEHAQRTAEIFGNDASETSVGDQLTIYTFEEVNYGNLEFLDRLTAAGIAWNSYWCGGDEYGPGTKYLRFTEHGEAVELETYYEALGHIEALTLSDILDRATSVDQVRLAVAEYFAKQNPLPWTDQLEFGKRYLASQLITP